MRYIKKFNPWMAERRSSMDETRTSLIDKEEIDIESRAKPTTANQISTQFSNTIRILKVQSAPFLQYSSLRLFAVFFILCIFVLSFWGTRSEPRKVETGNVSKISCPFTSCR